MRTKELQIAEENMKAIVEKTGLEFKGYIGDGGQQHYRRVPQFSGFKFLEPDKVDLKIWKKHNKHPQFFMPNRKTAAGRDMFNFLLNGLRSGHFGQVFEILKLERGVRFTYPYVEIHGETVVMYLGDDNIPTDENVIEITSKEFKQIQDNE
jgi:hypothetical protein